MATREQKNQWAREWYARNKEQHKAAVARWRAENPEKARASMRAASSKYGKANRDVLRRRDERRRLRMAKVWTQEGDDYAAFIANDPCVYCGGPSHGVDHIIPIAHGGTHTPDDLAPCCLDCNRRKKTLPMLHFLLARAAA